MALGVDTAWLARYEQRTDHPPDDAEKVTVADGRVTRVHRADSRQPRPTASTSAWRNSPRPARRGSASTYHRVREQFAGRPLREASVFEKAYMIQLFQEMIEAGERFAHVDTPGGYIEVDTQQDFDYARQHWLTRHSREIVMPSSFPPPSSARCRGRSSSRI